MISPTPPSREYFLATSNGCRMVSIGGEWASAEKANHPKISVATLTNSETKFRSAANQSHTGGEKLYFAEAIANAPPDHALPRRCQDIARKKKSTKLVWPLPKALRKGVPHKKTKNSNVDCSGFNPLRLPMLKMAKTLSPMARMAQAAAADLNVKRASGRVIT